MNEEEYNDCSVVAYPHEIRFLHIKGGYVSYYVDRHVSDYVDKLQKENLKLKEKLEASEKVRLKCLNKIKTLGKFDGEKCTRSFTLWSADFNELAKMLDIDKGE